MNTNTKNEELEQIYVKKLHNPSGGPIVTRFAPEPSGYLHIGHIKALLLNKLFVSHYGGKILLRFDDTNPSRENMEFQDSIIEDIQMLGIEFEGPSFSSDYFDTLEEQMRTLISKGFAYLDNTPADTMKEMRLRCEATAARDRSVDDNLNLFSELVRGTENGITYCVRAKIDMQSANACLRDPVFWRANIETPHHRHGTRYKSYPTYDFACPIIDSLSGVTHALRSNEYADRVPLYNWVQSVLEHRPVTIFEFSRLNMTNTVLSKRKLGKLVDSGYVDSWSDPRFPTIRGLLRRGLTPEALQQFIVEIGPTKNTNLMEWDKLWAINARILENIAHKIFGVKDETKALVKLTDVSEILKKSRPLHPKIPEFGTASVELHPSVFCDQEDLTDAVVGESVALLSMGNVILDQIEKTENGSVTAVTAHTDLEGDFKKSKKKLHWINNSPDVVSGSLIEYDHIITKKSPDDADELTDIVAPQSKFESKILLESLIKNYKVGDVLQLFRIGYVRIDTISPQINLILIPNGKSKSMSKLSTKVDPAKLAKGQNQTDDKPKLSKRQLKSLAFHKQNEDKKESSSVNKTVDAET